jgi:hypothetical protein
MPKKTSRARKILVAAWVGLAIPVLVWGFAHTNRPAIVQAYSWLEQKWVEHWPVERQKWEIEKLAPMMYRLGILGPAASKLNRESLPAPRDLIAVSILRGGAWRPGRESRIAKMADNGVIALAALPRECAGLLAQRRSTWRDRSGR